MDRALLTGATGFVGSHLARALLARGVEVHAIVRQGARFDRVPDLVDRVIWHTDDASAGAMRAIVATARAGTCFHLATHFVAEHAPEDVAPMVEANIAFPTRLADALADDDDGAAFVNVGTSWQHVDGAPFRPKNLYAATKQAFEDILRAYTARGSLRTVTVNLFDTYGPLDFRNKLVSVLVEAARSGESLAMGSGNQLIDLVHVDDVVDALLVAAAVAPGDCPFYAASSGRALRVRELVDLVASVADRPLAVQWGARPERVGEMLEPWDAGPPLAGWSPKVPLAQGLGGLLAAPAR